MMTTDDDTQTSHGSQRRNDNNTDHQQNRGNTKQHRYDVVVVGGGVAGLSGSIFTARAGLDTLVVDAGDSILARNAHLENMPGFPAGVNSLTFLELLEAQAERNGVRIREGRVASIVRGGRRDEVTTTGFDIALTDGSDLHAERVIAASWSDSSYLEPLDVAIRSAGSKQFIQPDGDGRTNVQGLYAAGRLAEQYHQAIVSAGHGAQVAISLIHDSDRPFYHDWVAPAGYFTDRGRELPPGCEEIDEGERLARERESIERMREAFDEPHPGKQRTHPSLEN